MSYKRLVCSGGGIKGLATLGGLQYVFEKGMLNSVDEMVGTSAGGMILFFMAIGYTPIEIAVYICSNKVVESMQLNSIESIVQATSLYDYATLQAHLERMIISKIGVVPTLLELYQRFHKHLVLVTYNLTTGTTVYLSHLSHPDLSCLDALRMTSNLPFIFNEFVYNQEEYIDGGITDNFPIQYPCEVFGPQPDPKERRRVLGLNLKRRRRPLDQSNTPSIEKVVYRVYNIITVPILEAEERRLKPMLDQPDVDIIQIELDYINVYSFSLNNKEKLDIFSVGYNTAKQFFESSPRSISDLPPELPT